MTLVLALYIDPFITFQAYLTKDEKYGHNDQV